MMTFLKTKGSGIHRTGTSVFICAAFALLIGFFKLQGAAPQWAHEQKDDLKPDSKVIWGMLENGFRYVIMPNKEPPERLSVRLLVEAGSFHEEEDQRGLAHFLEHMAFNGTKEFPPGEMVEYFQRLGMSFGGDTNAHTSFDETVYKLELPKTDDKMLEDGLRLLRDYGDGMLLGEAEIEKERGVILSEKRSRDSIAYRTSISEYEFLLPHSLIPKRLPIGEESVIKNATREHFTRYYNKWYTCDRMALIAVGNIDEEKLVPLIKKHFASMKPPEKRLEEPSLGEIRPSGLVVKLHSESEASSTSVKIETVQPMKKEPDSTEGRNRRLYRDIACSIINRRLEILSKRIEAPFSEGSCYAFEWLDFIRSGSIELTCKPTQWEDALKVAEQELRRAREFGFTKAELKEIKAKILNGYEQRVKAAPTRKSRALADSLTSSVSDERVFTSPEADLARVKKVMDSITPKTVHDSFTSLWATNDIYLFVSGNLTLENPDETIARVYKESHKTEVFPPVEVKDVAFAYTEFGEPTEIIDKIHHEDLNVTQIRFSNNVRLNLKPTDFQKNSISVKIRIGGGELTTPKDKPGLKLLTDSTFIQGGLIAHSADELERIFAGKTVGVGFSVAKDAFVFTGTSTPEDIDSQLQLMCAHVVAPGYRPEAIEQVKKSFDELYINLTHTPQGVMQNMVARYLASGDYRFGFPLKKTLESRTLDEVKAWMDEPLQSDYLEISLVGDFNVETMIALVNSTFGALPQRKSEKPDYTEERKLHFPEGPSLKKFYFDSKIPKAITVVYWPTADIRDIKRTRRLNLLSSILDDRMRVKIREEIGQAYSPYAYNSSSDTYHDYGYTMALVVVEPRQVDNIGNILEDIAAGIKEKGVTEDERERMIAPILEHIKETVRSNSYWLNTVISRSQEYPQRLDWARTMVDDYKAIMVDELNALAKQYFDRKKAVHIHVSPQAMSTEGRGGE